MVEPTDGGATVAPMFRTRRPNARVDLYEGPLALTLGGVSVAGDGRVSLEWLPLPVVAAEVPLERRTGEITLPCAGELQVRGFNSVPVSATARVDDSGALALRAFLTEDLETTQRADLHSVLFHIPNVWSELGRVEWQCSPWVVRISPEDDLVGLEAKLRAIGGYAITHTGKLEREDGGAFGSSDAVRFLEELGTAVSLARAAWCFPLLYIGHDLNKGIAWRDCKVRKVSAWKPARSWLPDTSWRCLESVLSGLVKRREDPVWRDAVFVAVSWYVEASTLAGTVETAYVLTQAALEMLATVAFVEEAKSVSQSGWRKLPAADKLRLLLQWAGIPLSIPKELAGVSSFALGKKWPDGPQALAEMRNGVAHGLQERVLGAPTAVRYQLKQLGLWYLELVLLRLFGFMGKYQSRMLDIHAEPVDVPWGS